MNKSPYVADFNTTDILQVVLVAMLYATTCTRLAEFMILLPYCI